MSTYRTRKPTINDYRRDLVSAQNTLKGYRELLALAEKHGDCLEYEIDRLRVMVAEYGRDIDDTIADAIADGFDWADFPELGDLDH